MSDPSDITVETRILGGIETRFRWRAGTGTPTVFVHGSPTHSAEWMPFLERLDGGVLAPDLPGYGGSERPDADRFAGGMHDHARWLGEALAELEVANFNLVVHDWGVLALILAQQVPEQVERLVAINSVPLLPGYRWHRLARIWRRRGPGEAFVKLATKRATALLLRGARPDRQPMPEEFVEMVWSCWDEGMAEAMLRLYRSADPENLEAAGANLDRLDCPALILWGTEDRYIPTDFGRAYAERLPAAELELVADAGHWPWIDDPQVIDRVCEFLEPGSDDPAPLGL
ncbi:MAG: alpha/beta fold hydrolase [Solirubrobacterales bacterium]